MKLLFDQNLSPRLVAQLDDMFAGSLHIRQVGLDRADDDTSNCSTQDIEAMLRKHAPHVSALEQETDNGFLVLL